MYALAASAAGVGLLAQPAEARIVYTPAHAKILPNTIFGLDLNHDGIIDFYFHNRLYSARGYSTAGTLSGRPVGGYPGLEGSSYCWRGTCLAYALPRGVEIGPSKFFGGTLLAQQGISGGGYGFWWGHNGLVTGYLGMRFRFAGAPHFGWARFAVKRIGLRYVATLTGYAYETIPNKPIIAGKTKGPDVITVQSDAASGTLGGLALGRK
jgi:hypothetical protein